MNVHPSDHGSPSAATRQEYRLLDLFCGAGGCTAGYQRAGFYVVGVDIEPQPNYCGDAFHQADALEVLSEWHFGTFDAIHASPPCQAYSIAQNASKNADAHPDLIDPVRSLLEATGLPWVIENVPGSPLRDPIKLCGKSFGLNVKRHRLFETNWPTFGTDCDSEDGIQKLSSEKRDICEEALRRIDAIFNEWDAEVFGDA